MIRVLWRWGLPLAALALVLVFAARQRPAPVHRETRLLMDTFVTVTVAGAAAERAQAACAEAFAALEAVHRDMGRRPGTELWSLNAAGAGTVSPELFAVVRAALDWAQRTDGAFDPTLATLLDLWDVAAGPKPPPEAEELRRALEATGWRRVSVDADRRRVRLDGVGLDLGGIAKGYAIDRAAEALRLAGLDDFLIDAGGDLYVAGSKSGSPWRVAIQHPREPAAYLRVLTPLPGALVTSGDYERAYEWQGRRIHHILDPRTGQPAAGCQSVTVWAPTALAADALATAAFVVGPGAGIALLEQAPGVEGLVVGAAGEVLESSGFREVAPAGDVP